MTLQGKLRRVRESIHRLRRAGGVRSVELERLARQLGRRRHARGKEPTWVSDLLPDARPISIPNHPGDLNRFTARVILDLLEEDAERISEQLLEEDLDG